MGIHNGTDPSGAPDTVLSVSTTGLGAEPPRKLRGRKRREWEAQAALDAANAAFARMDAAQRELRARFAAAPPPGFAELDAATDGQAKLYLDTQDRYPVAGVGKPELLAASAVYRQAAFDCVSQAEELEAFGRAHPPA